MLYGRRGDPLCPTTPTNQLNIQYLAPHKVYHNVGWFLISSVSCTKYYSQKNTWLVEGYSKHQNYLLKLCRLIWQHMATKKGCGSFACSLVRRSFFIVLPWTYFSMMMDEFLTPCVSWWWHTCMCSKSWSLQTYGRFFRAQTCMCKFKGFNWNFSTAHMTFCTWPILKKFKKRYQP